MSDINKRYLLPNGDTTTEFDVSGYTSPREAAQYKLLMVIGLVLAALFGGMAAMGMTSIVGPHLWFAFALMNAAGAVVFGALSKTGAKP